MKYTNDNGLLVDNSTTPPTCAGYIFNFTGHGAFAPSGKVGELTQAEIDTHNSLLAKAEIEALKKNGKGCLYQRTIGARLHVGTWQAGNDIPITCQRESLHYTPFARSRIIRKDVWFNFDGSRWHGVSIGDNDIVRVKRCKS